MSCSSPIYKFNPYTQSLSRIPCGWCMNCRVDKRTYFQDRFEFEYFKHFGGIGTFGCITYDDNHIPFGMFGDNWTLKKKHMQDFWKRVRSYINYHKDDFDPHFINPGFKHYTVGEYSDGFRPHYHFICVGLDYKVALPIFEKCWSKAVVIDSRPILDGGMSYVLKYVDKQQHGSQNDIYGDYGVEPPFLISSHKVGNMLYHPSNIDLQDLTYSWNGKKRPLPSWVKNKLFIPYRNIKQNPQIISFANKNNMSYDDADLFLRKARESLMEHKTLNNGRPVAPVKKFSRTQFKLQRYNSCFGAQKYYGSNVFSMES